MTIPSTQDDILTIIQNSEENLHLEFKAARALEEINDDAKKEIAKDVSAFANSDGGVILYGVKEKLDEKHRGELDPFDRALCSKEKLENIINGNISPKIENLLIKPITVNGDKIIYYISIPKSNTCHQNIKDKKYYKRHNFEASPMDDYEIRDVMNREKYPIIDLKFKITKGTYFIKDKITTKQANPLFNIVLKIFTNRPKKEVTCYLLSIICKNVGNIYAKYINCAVIIPSDVLFHNENYDPFIVTLNKKEFTGSPVIKVSNFLDDNDYKRYIGNLPEANGYAIFSFDNGIQDKIDYIEDKDKLYGGRYVYGPKRYDPILPDCAGDIVQVVRLKDNVDLSGKKLLWSVHADNAPINANQKEMHDIPVD
ncbi:MAG: ATP-binding protein [Bacteroidales bacterium]|jgi:hypothetical protein|nr:ATP-binding protein [Bacteroidales bacterium]